MSIKKSIANAFSATDAKALASPCDNKISPIYPVRYAYANIFDEQLNKALPPPSIQTLLNAKNITDGDGYVARLLHQGWVYIREEDQDNDWFHIFEYTHKYMNGKMHEQFTKFEFKNKINAQAGLDKKGAFPFPFVRRDVKKISILFTDHQLSANIIDKLHQNKGGKGRLRTDLMQQIDLDSDQNRDAIAANEANITQLVEDYRIRQDRLLGFKGWLQNEGSNKANDDYAIKKLTLDILSSTQSYDMDAQDIIDKLNKSCYVKGKSVIVALHDPVGRQIELASAHSKLAQWEKQYQSKNIYPFTIGKFIGQMQQSKNTKIEKLIQENINTDEFNQYWQQMDRTFGLFKDRQKELIENYEEYLFSGNAKVTGTKGSLDTYFKAFFEAPSKNSDDEDRESAASNLQLAELDKLVATSTAIFDGLLSSQTGTAALEKAFNELAENQELSKSHNALTVILDTLAKLVTHPQGGNNSRSINFAGDVLKQINKFLVRLGPLLGKVIGQIEYSSQISKLKTSVLSKQAMLWIHKFSTDNFLDKQGLKYHRSKVIFKEQKLAEIFSEVIDQQSSGHLSQANKVIKEAELIQAKGAAKVKSASHKMFGLYAEKAFSLSAIENLKNPQITFKLQVKGEKLALLMDNKLFPGFSLLLNTMTIAELACQTEYAKSNPLDRNNRIKDVIGYSAAITSMTIDSLALLGAISINSNVLKTISLPGEAMTKLLPGLKGKGTALGRLIFGQGLTKLVAAANFLTAVDSIWDAHNAWQRGNKGDVAGKGLVALGSTLLFADAMIKLTLTAKEGSILGSLVGGGPKAVSKMVLAGFGFIAVGLVTSFSNQISQWERLLKNCFWGNGDKYAFWPEDPKRLLYRARLLKSQSMLDNPLVTTHYQIELQEFINQFNMPNLNIKRSEFSSNSNLFTFKLPSFQGGKSGLVFEAYTPKGLLFGPDEDVSDPKLTHYIQQRIDYAMNRDRYSENKQGSAQAIEREPMKYGMHSSTTPFYTSNKQQSNDFFELNGGSAILRVLLPYGTNIKWHYALDMGDDKQQRAPLIVPMRYLDEDGVLGEAVIGFKNEKLV